MEKARQEDKEKIRQSLCLKKRIDGGGGGWGFTPLPSHWYLSCEQQHI